MANSAVLRDKLYPIVEASLKKPENNKLYKSNIDHYMAKHIDCYSSVGPSTRPTLSPSDVSNFLQITGLTDSEVKACLKEVKGNSSSWKNFNNPYNIAIVLSIRYYTLKKDENQVRNGLLYMLTNIYQYMFFKYYKFAPNEAVMNYTMANLSQRFKIKKFGTILATLLDITTICYETHKERLKKCEDMDIVKFINDVTSRINSFMKKLCNEYTTNFKEDRYLQSEHDDYSDENYYEADNDSFAIDRITNKVLTNLIVNGPDRKLVELAAKNSTVSVNTLQTCILTLISDNNRGDIKTIIECLLSLYLNDPENKNVSIRDVGNNKFYVYCIKVYRQSNSSNENIKIIRSILDRWIKELDLESKVTNVGTLGNYRKAIYTFFVFTIEKLS